jgi:hypothetical protein
VAWETLRSIVEELDVSEQVDLYTEKFRRFDEAWEGLKWLLARTPDLKGAASWVGEWVGEGSFRAYAAAGNPLADTPDIWVIYSYTESVVLIMGVQAVVRPPEGDE